MVTGEIYHEHFESIVDEKVVQSPENIALTKQARSTSLAGILLCFERHQRYAFILGAIF